MNPLILIEDIVCFFYLTNAIDTAHMKVMQAINEQVTIIIINLPLAFSSLRLCSLWMLIALFKRSIASSNLVLTDFF